MIYLVHCASGETRTCESERTAGMAEARGFARVSRAEHRAQRRENDVRRRDELLAADTQAADAQAAAPPAAPAPTIAVPPGFTVFPGV
jgi:hypothetical protein